MNKKQVICQYTWNVYEKIKMHSPADVVLESVFSFFVVDGAFLGFFCSFLCSSHNQPLLLVKHSNQRTERRRWRNWWTVSYRERQQNQLPTLMHPMRKCMPMPRPGHAPPGSSTQCINWSCSKHTPAKTQNNFLCTSLLYFQFVTSDYSPFNQFQ